MSEKKACGCFWYAPKRMQSLSPSGEPYEVTVEQFCVLDKGHEGDHRSGSNVVCPQAHARQV